MTTKEGQTRRHVCHWPGCGKQVPPAAWGCKYCWVRLPAELRTKIWATYSPGQEIRCDPSVDYLKVAKEVQDWIATYVKAQWEAFAKEMEGK